MENPAEAVAVSIEDLPDGMRDDVVSDGEDAGGARTTLDDGERKSTSPPRKTSNDGDELVSGLEDSDKGNRKRNFASSDDDEENRSDLEKVQDQKFKPKSARRILDDDDDDELVNGGDDPGAADAGMTLGHGEQKSTSSFRKTVDDDDDELISGSENNDDREKRSNDSSDSDDERENFPYDKPGQKSKVRKPNPAREAKNLALEEIKLKQETQRMVRDSRLCLPRHRPKEISLNRFLHLFGCEDVPEIPEKPRVSVSEPLIAETNVSTEMTSADEVKIDDERTTGQQGQERPQEKAYEALFTDGGNIESTNEAKKFDEGESITPQVVVEEANLKATKAEIQKSETQKYPNLIPMEKKACLQPANDPLSRLKQRLLNNLKPKAAPKVAQPTTLHLHIRRQDSGTGEIQLSDEPLTYQPQATSSLSADLDRIHVPGAKLPALKAKLEAEIQARKLEAVIQQREQNPVVQSSETPAEDQEEEFADDEMGDEIESSDSSDDEDGGEDPEEDENADDEEAEKEEDEPKEKNEFVDDEAEEDDDDDELGDDLMDESGDSNQPDLRTTIRKKVENEKPSDPPLKEEVDESSNDSVDLDEILQKAAVKEDEDIAADPDPVEPVEQLSNGAVVEPGEPRPSENPLSTQDQLLAVLSCGPEAFCMEEPPKPVEPSTQISMFAESEDEEDEPIKLPVRRARALVLDDDDEQIASLTENPVNNGNDNPNTDQEEAAQPVDQPKTSLETEDEPEEDAGDVEDDDDEEGERLPSDDEELNYLDNIEEEPRKPVRVKDFLEEEAELSDEENYQGSGDEEEGADLDAWDPDMIDDKLKLDPKKWRKQVADLQMKQMQEEDAIIEENIKMMINMDEELDGIGRIKSNFFAQGQFDLIGDRIGLSDDENEDGQEPNDLGAAWRVQRFEREQVLAQMGEKELKSVLGEIEQDLLGENPFTEVCRMALKRGIPADTSIVEDPDAGSLSQSQEAPPLKRLKSTGLFNSKEIRARMAEVIAKEDKKKPEAPVADYDCTFSNESDAPKSLRTKISINDRSDVPSVTPKTCSIPSNVQKRANSTRPLPNGGNKVTKTANRTKSVFSFL